jgi:hypothetical protein
MPLSRIPTRSRTLAAKPRPCRCEIRWKARPVSSLPWQARAARRIWRTRDLAWSSSPFEQPGNHDWWRSIRSARGSAAKALPLPLDSSLAAPDRKVRPISRPDGRGSTTAIDVVDGARSRHQTHLVAELRQLARPMVRRGTGLNADQARRHAKATRSKVRFRTQLGV